MGLTPDVLEAFHKSLDRVLSNESFLDEFYDSFIGKSEEVSSFFKNTNFEHQKRKLATTLRLITMAADDSPGADIYLEYLGKYHRDIKVPEHLYEVWRKALISSARNCDPEFDQQTEDAWGACIEIGINNVLKAYNTQ